MTALAPREAYRLWAASYEPENAITFLEQRLVESLGPSPGAKRLLDAGCGTGRRLGTSKAALAVGVDLSPEMLAQARSNPWLASATLLEGDICVLPLADCQFDLVWCRLALGHIADLDRAYAELSRVTRLGGDVIATDFHPTAHAAGHRRTFRVGEVVHEVVHHPRSLAQHTAAARKAGLSLRGWDEASIGAEAWPFYAAAGRKDLFAEHEGLPVVLGLAFCRDA